MLKLINRLLPGILVTLLFQQFVLPELNPFLGEQLEVADGRQLIKGTTIGNAAIMDYEVVRFAVDESGEEVFFIPQYDYPLNATIRIRLEPFSVCEFNGQGVRIYKEVLTK
ncbi:MAG: hypothetical protein AAF741_09085 [Bacteroidota bacterium]